MELFPTSVVADVPVKVSSQWKTLVSDFETGKEQRRRRWAFPRRSVTLSYVNVSLSEMDLLWKFYNARKGDFDPFHFVVPYKDYWYAEYLAHGDGTNRYCDLCSLETTKASVVVYVNGVLSSFTFYSGGGQNGSDRVRLAVAPAAGSVVTADFYGKLRLTSRFAEAELSKEVFTGLLFKTGLQILQVKETRGMSAS